MVGELNGGGGEFQQEEIKDIKGELLVQELEITLKLRN